VSPVKHSVGLAPRAPSKIEQALPNAMTVNLELTQRLRDRHLVSSAQSGPTQLPVRVCALVAPSDLIRLP